MRAALVLLVLANLLLAFAVRRTRGEHEALVREKAELEERLVGTESSREERRALAALVETYSERVEVDGQVPELGIASLRDALLGAERGLGIERLSLEFRPQTDLARGFAGSRIQASLRGSYEALYRYLSRLESLHLPLAPAELALRAESDGAGSLAVRFAAAWPAPGSGDPGALSAEEVARLSRWLEGSVAPAPSRNLFRVSSTAASGPTPTTPLAAPPPPGPSEDEPALAEEPPPARLPPALVGFVLARPEVEPDVSRRVLAALRYDGSLHLAAVGASVGAYTVEAIASRESVTLFDESTGERILLRLR